MLKRIVIFGRPGSGKSTVASWLSQNVGLPLHHLDKHFYLANWQPRPYPDFMHLLHTIVNEDEWIIDGNNTRSLETRWARADLVLYFNLPRFICYLRVIKRFLAPHHQFDDRAPECRETIRWSLLRYIWGFNARVSPLITRLTKQYPHVTIKEIRCNADVTQLKHDLMLAVSAGHHWRLLFP